MNPLSGVLGEAWQMYKAHAAHLLAIAFVIYLAAAVIAALLALAGAFGALLGFLVEIVAAFLLQATLVKAVQDVRDGRADLSIGETVSAATPYIGPVALASILAGIAIAIGLALLIVPGLFLITIWAVIVPVIVLERSGALASFGRSYQLVRGRAWHVFGTLVLVFVIMLVVNLILGLTFSALPYVWRSGLSSIISGTLIAPFLALVVTLVYYRLVSGSQASPPVSGEAYGAYQQSPQGAGPYATSQQPQQDGGSYGGFPPPSAAGEAYRRPPQAPAEGEAYGRPPPSPAEGEAYGWPSPPPAEGEAYGTPSPPPAGGEAYGTPSPPPAGGEAYRTPSPPPAEGETYGSPPQAPPENGAHRDPTPLPGNGRSGTGPARPQPPGHP